MTENEWLSATYPTPMLAFLQGRVSDRKLRLFAVACCRQAVAAVTGVARDKPSEIVHRLLAHERQVVDGAIRSVDTAERYVDRQVGQGEAVAAYVEVLQLLSGRRPREESWAYVLVAALRATWTGTCFYGQNWEVEELDAWLCARDAADFAARAAPGVAERVPDNVWVGLIRDIFGNPFRPVTADPSWLTPTVTSLAEAIYADRAFDRLPILADALEEAGCDNSDVLNHCRGDSVHVRGCWVVDLVLGKK